VNYLQYIYDAVSDGTQTPVFSYAAPQGYMGDFIVIRLNGIDVSETKDNYKAERLSATLFLHYADADNAQAELSTIRAYLQTVHHTFTLAYMDGAQMFYNEDDETVILAADFTFLINY
jgi:hypothetical protein